MKPYNRLYYTSMFFVRGCLDSTDGVKRSIAFLSF